MEQGVRTSGNTRCISWPSRDGASQLHVASD